MYVVHTLTYSTMYLVLVLVQYSMVSYHLVDVVQCASGKRRKRESAGMC